jgi:hypothetical protein
MLVFDPEQSQSISAGQMLTAWIIVLSLVCVLTISKSRKVVIGI